MKTLKTLIRLKKDELDRLQKELVQIQERQQKLKDEHADLGAALVKEGEIATQSLECMGTYAGYAKRTIERQKILLRNIDMLQTAIEKKREELLIQFGEQKKFEIALEQRELAVFNENKARESRMMDEVAIRGFSRKDEGFTLVELSIVLVIIGLLIGGILAAQSMITTARDQRIVRDMEKYQIAIRLFKSKYNYLPGTNSGAKAHWYRGPNTGDDSWVDARRGFTMFTEMYQMGMLDQKYDSTIMGSTYQVDPNPTTWPGVVMPKIGNGAVIFGVSFENYTASDISAGLMYGSVQLKTSCSTYNFFRMAKFDTASPDYGPENYFNSPAIDSINAKAVDAKLDDGSASGGKVIAAGACSAYNIAVGDYNSTSGTDNCIMYFCAEPDD